MIEWKLQREQLISDAMKHIDHTDFEDIITWLVNSDVLETDSMRVIPPNEKIARNDLSSSTERIIRLAMPQMNEVRLYINTVATTRTGYADLLVGSLLKEYGRLRLSGENNDDIFNELARFACGNSRNATKLMAGWAVVVFFFERCDLFES